jgi:hypothetical protein
LRKGTTVTRHPPEGLKRRLEHDRQGLERL